jgi:hypothetical protein
MKTAFAKNTHRPRKSGRKMREFIDRVRRLDGLKAGTPNCRRHPTGPDFL